MSLAFERPEFLWLLLLWLPLASLAWYSRRKLPVHRRILALVARTLLLLAVVFALAELTLRRQVDDLAVVFVVDRSASVGPSGERATDAFVSDALQHAGASDVSGMVVFGADAMVESEPRPHWSFHGVEGVVNPHQSDLAAGLRLGTAVLPADRTRRLVLLSDGEQTLGDVAAQTLQITERDLEVSVVPVGRDPGPEVWLSDLVAPARVDTHAAFELRVVANSEQPASGLIRLYRNADYLGQIPVELEGGRARALGIREEANEPGLYRYRAVLELEDASADLLPQNNQVVATVQVAGKPRVLIAEGDAGQARHLQRVLVQDGLEVDVVDIAGIPANLEELRPYAAVFLSDIPSYALTRRQQESLRAHVRDLGKGLVMLGGDRSFGVGGYFQTPIEEALPVRMDIEDKTRFPKLAMVLAIDKSCSMGGGAGSKLGLAREAAIRTAELLSERDSLGVIGFDGAASWIAPMRPLTSRQAILDDIAALRPGGGTDIYPALKTAINTLDNSDAALKHIILLSDGMTTPGDYAPLIQGAFGRDITLTTIGIGTDADSDTMKDFAGWGGGEFYLVTQPHAIPAIFTRETLLASRAFLIEEPFRPAMGTPSEIVRALDPSTIPTLHGYVATQAKHRATTPLVVPDPEGGDLPLLAHWRYGLGRSVAFTSDAKGRWAREWIGQPSYTHLWTQVTRWVVGDLEPSNLAVDTEIRAGALWVTVDAYDALGSFRNFLDGEARVVAPDLRVHHLDLQQIAPGRYQGTLPVDQDGSWLVGVALSEGDKLIGQAVSEAVQPYSPEYRAKGAGGAVLEDVGRTGGGGQLTDPATVFSRPDVPRRVPTPLWPTLLAMAGFLLLADVAVRRLDWFDRAQGQARPARPAKRTRRWTLRTDPVRNRPRMQDTEDPDAHDAPTAPAQPASEVPAESYAGRLLAARKKARDRLDDDG